jgi:hypothetical protein
LKRLGDVLRLDLCTRCTCRPCAPAVGRHDWLLSQSIRVHCGTSRGQGHGDSSCIGRRC